MFATAIACAGLFLAGYAMGIPEAGFVAALFPATAYLLVTGATRPPQPRPRVEQAVRPSRWGVGLGVPLGPLVLSVWRRVGRG
jgi:NADH:ubiquinone oxidoreductase subunit H